MDSYLDNGIILKFAWCFIVYIVYKVLFEILKLEPNKNPPTQNCGDKATQLSTKVNPVSDLETP